MRGTVFLMALAASLLWCGSRVGGEPSIFIRLTSYAERRASEASVTLYSFPPEDCRGKYGSEAIVYVPGEKAHIRIEMTSNGKPLEGQITLTRLVSEEKSVLYSGPLETRTYGPYEVPIASNFEIYQVSVQAGDKTAAKGFYGIRPWRGMKDFAEAVSPYGISLGYEKTALWDAALLEGGVPLDIMDPNWARDSHIGKGALALDDWWLWTHYACGLVGLEHGRTGLFWGEYNPWTGPKLRSTQTLAPSKRPSPTPLISQSGALLTDTLLPNEIYFRERIQPMLRKCAENVSEKHPGVPLTMFLGHGWGIGQGSERKYEPETLRFFVSWMKEQFNITLEAETFKELIQKCEQYPKHLDYFLARNTAFRSLELTCEAVQDIVADSKAYDRNRESNRQLIALPEAVEFCEVLSRCISVGISDDRSAFSLAHGNPLPYTLCNMVIKAFAPEHRLCVGWNGCPAQATDGQIYRWFLEPAWLTAYGPDAKLHHVYTHSPPERCGGLWKALLEESVPDDRIPIYDKCFQLMEAIGVEKPIGPVFVCKDWTFADDKSGKAFRSDLYEDFLIAIRRQKVPVSCAVHADHEAKLRSDLPRVYAPRMNGAGKIRFGFKAGSAEKWLTCEAERIPDSLIADFAQEVNSASGNPVIFPAATSIQGYAFEAKGMIFVVAEEMAGRKERGEIRVKVGDGRRTVIDAVAARVVPSKRDGEYVAFSASLGPNSATLYCLVPGKSQ